MPKIYWLRYCIDFFIDDTHYRNDDERYRARILAGCLLFIAIIALITGFSISFIYTGAPNNYIGINLTAFICILYTCLLFVLKRTGKTQLLAQAFSIPLYASLIISAFVAGGAEATSSQIMCILPIMMFFTSGIRIGLLWAAIVIFTETAIYSLYWGGYEFQQHMNHTQAIEQSFVHFLVTITGLTVIAFTYERANQRLIEERNDKNKDNYMLSRYDLLTGLTNRSTFFHQLEHQINQAKRKKTNIHLLIIDINNLEHINQTFGYKEADNIIASFANRLKIQADFTCCARLHGKRFALSLLSDQKELCDKTLSHLQQAINQPFTSGHQIITLQYNFSHSCNFFDTTVDQLMNQAEQTMDSP